MPEILASTLGMPYGATGTKISPMGWNGLAVTTDTVPSAISLAILLIVEAFSKARFLTMGMFNAT